MNQVIYHRNREFLGRCLEIMYHRQVAGLPLDYRRVVELALDTRPCVHYVTYDNASRSLRRLQQKGFRSPVATEQWREMAEQVEAERVARGCSPREALSRVICFRRPSRFHISYQRARRILTDFLRNRYKNI